VIEVSTYISSVARTVGSRTLHAGEARVGTIARSYNTDIHDLWDACTNVERIPRWFMSVTGELKVGGTYQLEANASGTIERCDPPHGFDITWEYGGEVSWVTVRLTAEAPTRTRFELEHVAHVDDSKWDEYGPGAVGVGWDLTLLGLALYYEQGGAFDKQAVVAWTMSDEGRALMAASSDAWCAANIAGGADPTRARDGAARTTAAYTGA
jgi:uncharacterized protein YndB with AHSA1/START domain